MPMFRVFEMSDHRGQVVDKQSRPVRGRQRMALHLITSPLARSGCEALMSLSIRIPGDGWWL